MDIDALKAELTGDPLTRGYAGMTDAQAATNLNAVNRTRNKTSLTGSQVLNAVDKTEFNALVAANKQLVWDILHLGDLNPFGIEADLMTDVFGGGSTTIAALAVLRVEAISRAVELGLGVVKVGHVQMARL